MPPPKPPLNPPLSRPARFITVLMMALFFTAIIQFAILLPELGSDGVLVDFDAFYIVGQMFWEGRVTEAYDSAVMQVVQRELVGHDGFMPWTYPPQFDLIALLLPAAPRGVSYALFTGTTLALYLVVLARLSGPLLPWILLALAPPIYVTTSIGQNAFLTGSLMGLFCLLTLRQSNAAGWPLGLLVIKPHLGIGLGIHALASGRWQVLTVAIAVVVVTSGLATLVLGVDIWAAFLGGARQAAETLRSNFYPLFRMTSTYAALSSLGVPAGVAIWVQSVVGLAACALIVIAVRRGVPLRYTLAMAFFTSGLVSPYLYDYDMAATGLGLALIGRDIWARTALYERVILLALVWVAGGWGMVHALSSAGLEWEERAANARATLSYGAFAYGLTLLLLVRILRRPAMP